MRCKLLNSYVKGELHTNPVDNFVEKKNNKSVFCYKNSLFVSLVVF